MITITNDTEYEFANLVFGYVVDDIDLQCNQDIDVVYDPYSIMNNYGYSYHKTVSVKCQDKAHIYGNVVFEVGLEDKQGNIVDGNFKLCCADEYAIATHNEWWIFDSVKLKSFVYQNYTKKTTTTVEIEKGNESEGRKYIKSHLLLVKYDELRSIADEIYKR